MMKMETGSKNVEAAARARARAWPADLLIVLVVLLCSCLDALRLIPHVQAEAVIWANSHYMNVNASRNVHDVEEQGIAHFMMADLWHRDSPSSPWRVQGATPMEELAATMRRSAARVNVLRKRTRIKQADVQAGAVLAAVDNDGPNKNPQGDARLEANGEYFMTMELGTPHQTNYFLVDIGSDLTWVQCQPCSNCAVNGMTEIFNPAKSTTFIWIPCSSNYCTAPDYPTSCTPHGRCAFNQPYADAGFDDTIAGEIAGEIFFLDNTNIYGVLFGCAHNNDAPATEGTGGGLLALGAGPFSLASQVEKAVFFCLPGRLNPGTQPGFVGLGSKPLPQNTVFTGLLRSPVQPANYYVPLIGISINGSPVPFTSSDIILQPDGYSGVIIDTAITFSALLPRAYSELQNAFLFATTNFVPAPPTGGLDTCYEFPNGLNRTLVPTMDLHFDGGASIRLPPENIMIQTGVSIYCLGFAISSLQLSILGNMQLEGFFVLIDTKTSIVGFAPYQC